MRVLLLACAAAASSDPRAADVRRVRHATNGTRILAPCWGRGKRGEQLCASPEEALDADASFRDAGTIAVVTAWCGEDFTWVAKLLSGSDSVARVWRRLIVYQKCAVYKTAKGYEVRLKATPIMMAANLTKAKQIAVEATGPFTTLTSIDVRRAIAKDILLLKTYATASTAPLENLVIEVRQMIEPGRGWPRVKNARPPFSTDEVGAYLDHISQSYEHLLDGTFFLHGSPRATSLELAKRTMDWTHQNGVAPQTFFGTTDSGAQRLDPLPGHLGIAKESLRTRRVGNYDGGEFYASRLSLHRRTRAFYANALEIVLSDTRCADRYVNCSGGDRRKFCGGKGGRTALPEPFAAFNSGERECPVPRRYRGSSRIEGYWNVFLCEACRAPPRPRDPRIPFSVDGVGDKLDAQNKGSYAVFGLKHPGRSGRRRLAARGGLRPNARAYWATRSSGRASILDHARPNGLGRPGFAPKPFVPIRYDPDGPHRPFSPLSALCGGLGVCPGPEKCYVKVNDDRATHKEGVRATYKCAEGPPGGKWNLAGDLPPTTTNRVGRRRAYRRAREELAMLEREARPKQKPVKNTLTYHTTLPLLLQRLPERV